MKRPISAATLAAVLGFLGIAHAQTSNVVVMANPVWTDTGLSLANAQSVSITATGSWAFYYSGGGLSGSPVYYGPDGQPGATNSSDAFLAGVNAGSLIAFVGPDPYQGHEAYDGFFPQATGYWEIGSGAQFASDKTGELWLGINDAAHGNSLGAANDNVGSVTAFVTVPEPSTCMLTVFAALLGALASKQRKRSTV